MGLGRWDESKTVAAEAAETARTMGADAEESRARTFLGSDLVALGEIDVGLAELQRAHELALRDGRSDLLIATGYNLALNLLLAADRFEESHQLAMRMWQVAGEVGLERRFGMDLAALAGDALIRLGRWDEADALTHDGLALAQRHRTSPYLAAVRARLAALRGARGEAEQRLSDIGDLADEPDTAAFVAAVRAEAALARDESGEAASIAHEALRSLAADNVTGNALWAAPLIALGVRALADLAETARAAHDAKWLATLRRDLEPFTARLAGLGGAGIGPGGLAWVATATAELSRFEGEARTRDWSAAVDAWRAIPDPYLAAYTAFRGAEAGLRAEGIRADVGDGLRAAHRTATTLRAQPLQRAIEELAGRARIDLAADQPVDVEPEVVPATGARGAAPTHRLSAREVEVLRLVAAGRTNGEIAEELFITRKTAGVHVTHILDKLGVSNRVEAAMAAARLGIASAGEEG
jgi:DNA-binding CsgD family transcriptional regulator